VNKLENLLKPNFHIVTHGKADLLMLLPQLQWWQGCLNGCNTKVVIANDDILLVSSSPSYDLPFITFLVR
jgi:hypothetical protein